jgi:type IV pilus assembly protein PilC
MPQYQYTGVGSNGKTINGTMAAGNAEEVASLLRRKRVRVTKVEPVGSKAGGLSKILNFGKNKVTQEEVSVFTRQFSVMIDAGLPLVQCLDILSKQSLNKYFGEVLAEVREEMEGGAALADALGQHRKVFPELYCNMIAAGEAGGILDVILRRLATYIEKSVKLKRAVKSASIYPVVIISVACTVVMIILWKVIPTFAGLFAGLGAQLPMPTRIVVFASNFVAAYMPFMIVGGIALVFATKSYYKTDGGERMIDSFTLKVPVVGMLLRKIAVARFCRTLATLVTSGVPILESLSITASTSGNRVISDAVMNTRRSIEAGRTLAKPLQDSGAFPPMVTQMIAVGEETGALDTMLSKIATFYEEEVDTAVEGLMALLEPVMIVFLGTVIGGIVVAMYLPMFDLINKI